MTALAWIVAGYLLIGVPYAAVSWHRSDSQEKVEEGSRAVPEFDSLRTASPRMAAVVYYFALVMTAIQEMLAWPYILVRWLRRRARYRRDWKRMHRD